jgi:hypothetical protein
MPALQFKRGQTSVILRVKLYDNSVTQAGKTAMTFHRTASSSPRSTTRRCRSPIPRPLARSRQSPLLGTDASPAATKCRFLLVDDTNHPGIHETRLAGQGDTIASQNSGKFEG